LSARTEDSFSMKVFTEIDGIKTGKIADTRGWVMKV
jgi:hypothetical protein